MIALPASPEVVGAYLAAKGEGYAKSTLRRRVAAIARASAEAGAPLNTKHPAIRDTLRGVNGGPARRAQALTTPEVVDVTVRWRSPGRSRQVLAGLTTSQSRHDVFMASAVQIVRSHDHQPA